MTKENSSHTFRSKILFVSDLMSGDALFRVISKEKGMYEVKNNKTPLWKSKPERTRVKQQEILKNDECNLISDV